MRKGSQPKSDEWAHSAIEEVELLDDGGTVPVKPTSLARSILGGRIADAALKSIAERFHYDVEFDPGKLPSAEERQAWEDFMDWMVADAVQLDYVTPEYVRDKMPFKHRMQLFRVATHQDLAGKLTLRDLEKFRLGDTSAVPASNGKAAKASAK